MSKFKYWALTIFGIFTVLVFGGGSLFIGIRTGWLDLAIGIVFIVSGLLFIPYFQKKFFEKYPPDEQLKKGTGFGLLTMILGIGLSFYSGKKLMENPPEIPVKKEQRALASVKSGFYWGLITPEGEFIEPAKYQNIVYVKGAFLCFDANGKRILRTAEKRYEIPGELDEILQYYNTNVLARSRNTGKFGIFNLIERRWKFSPEAEWFGEIRYDLLPLLKSRLMVLDLQNNRYLLVPGNADTVFVVNDSLIAFRISDKFGIMNTREDILEQDLDYISQASPEGTPVMLVQGRLVLFPKDTLPVKNAVKAGESLEETLWFLANNGKYYFYEQGAITDSAEFVVLKTSDFPSAYLIVQNRRSLVKYQRYKLGVLFFPGQWSWVSELLFPVKKEKFVFYTPEGEKIISTEWDSVGSYFLKVYP